MRKDEDIEQEMYDSGITVISRSVSGYKGLLVKHGPTGYVFLSPRLTSRTRAVILAEEYAHYQISTGDTVRATDGALIDRTEGRALRCAIGMLITPEDVDRAKAAGAATAYDLAEALDLPESFIRLALDVWRVQGKQAPIYAGDEE